MRGAFLRPHRLPAADLRASAWKADLDFLAQQLPKLHKNLFESLPELPDMEVRTKLPRVATTAANGARLVGIGSLAWHRRCAEKLVSPVPLGICLADAIRQQGKLKDLPDYETPLYLSHRQTLYWFRYLGESREVSFVREFHQAGNGSGRPQPGTQGDSRCPAQ